MSEQNGQRAKRTRRAKLLTAWLIGIIVVGSFYYAALVYPIGRIVGLIFSPAPTLIPVLFFMVLLPVAGRASAEWWPSEFTRALSRIGMTMLGAGFVALPLVLTFELINAMLPLAPQVSGMVLAGLLLAISIAAFANALTIRPKTVLLDTPMLRRPVRIVQISDLHLGSLPASQLARTVTLANAQQPDYVVLTGDIVDFAKIPARQYEPLSQLSAPAYFVIGNHERYVDTENICQHIEQAGITVLRNASAVHDQLQFIGIDDAESKQQVASILPTMDADPERYRVLLYHRPDGAEDAARWGANLMLCGHTHNGQILPFNFLVRRFFPRILGEYPIGDLKLYVSAGTGVWGPLLRVGSRSELTVLNLVPGNPHSTSASLGQPA